MNIGGAKLRISEGMSARHGNLIIRRTSEHVFVTLPNMVQGTTDLRYGATLIVNYGFLWVGGVLATLPVNFQKWIFVC